MSRAAAFTTRSKETVKPTADRQEISGSLLLGFYLIVQPLPPGAKSWVVRYPISKRVRSTLAKMCNWRVEEEIISASPCVGVKSQAPSDRARGSSTTLSCVSVDQLGGPYGVLVKVLISTGQRRDEVGSMRCSKVDLDAALWKLPAGRVKSGAREVQPRSQDRRRS